MADSLRRVPGLRSKEIALGGVVLALTLALYFLMAFSDLPAPYFILILFYPLITRWIKGILIMASLSHIARYTVIVTELYRSSNEALAPILSQVDPQAAYWIYVILSSPFIAYYFMGLIMALMFLGAAQALTLALEKVGYFKRLEALREAFNL